MGAHGASPCARIFTATAPLDLMFDGFCARSVHHEQASTSAAPGPSSDYAGRKFRLRLTSCQHLIRRRLMFKDESGSPLTYSGASEAASPEQRGSSSSNHRLPVRNEIGFVGLGRMGTAM